MANRRTTRREAPRTRPETERPKRISLEEQKDLITVQRPDDDYVYRYVNDMAMANGRHRIAAFELAGWEVVDDEISIGEDGNANIAGGTTGAEVYAGLDKVTRQPVKSILMRIHKDLYDEDFIKKQRKLDAQDAALKRKTKELIDDPLMYGDVKTSF